MQIEQPENNLAQPPVQSTLVPDFYQILNKQ